MMRYIALFRGINVSGQKIIKMADLRERFADWGFENVVTYIQSGNVIFQSKNKDQDAFQLASLLKEKVKDTYGFDVQILITDASELKASINNCPFDSEQIERTYFTLLDQLPKSEKLQSINPDKYAPDQFALVDKTVYIYCPNGAGKSKLTNNLFEKKLGVNATTRNLNTMKKLIELAGS